MRLFFVGEAELVLDARASLGEGAFWDDGCGLLYWVDIEGRLLHVYNPGSGRDAEYETADRVGTVVTGKGGGIVFAEGLRVVTADRPGGKTRTLCTFEDEPPGNRLNDGKCGPAGRLWIGSMNMGGEKERARLYCVYPDGSYRTMLSNVSISNGIVWTADRRKMYYIDTPKRTVQIFDYDFDFGSISNGRTAFEVPSTMGFPDGMAIDSEDMLWIAHYGGAAVRRWDPTSGSCLETVHLPVINVTSCAFGGPDLRDLFITTARLGRSKEETEREPRAGGLFRCRPTIPGVPQYKFG